MKILGAILAGGRSQRFGSDKAAAELGGKPLLEHVSRALAPQVADLVIVGRDWPGVASIDDWPDPGLGPLGGLAGALKHADAHGFTMVLTTGCDVPNLPADLAARLMPGTSYVADQPVIGLWSPSHAAALSQRLMSGDDHSLFGFANAIAARAVAVPGLVNVNRPADLAEIPLSK